MADISKELYQIKTKQFGEEIRFPIHDALKAIADETPAVDPRGPWYIITSAGEFVITNLDEDFVIAYGYDMYDVTTSSGERIVSTTQDDYMQAKE